MKLVTFAKPSGQQRIGIVCSDLHTIFDLKAAADAQNLVTPAFESMLALIESGDAGLALAQRLFNLSETTNFSGETKLPLSTVKLLAPVPVPAQMRDFLAFEKHYKQARQQALRIRAATYSNPVEMEKSLAQSDEFNIPPIWYEQPVYYKGNRFSVIGPEQDISWPSYSKKLDFELEFGIFISKRGKNITRETAHEYIFGYCIFNDMSARDAQYREYPGRLGPAKGKDFDTGNILGPWLVTKDEIPNPYALEMIVRVNGEEWGRGNSESMYHKFEDMIVHASNEETLHPGEFIGSGTVGDGCGLEHDRWIKLGDVIELEVSGLGVLRNRVMASNRSSSADARHKSS